MALIWPRLTAEDVLNREIDDEALRRDDVEELLDPRLEDKEASDLLLAAMDVGFFSNESSSSFLVDFRFAFSCPAFCDFLLEDRSLDDLIVFGFLFWSSCFLCFFESSSPIAGH